MEVPQLSKFNSPKLTKLLTSKGTPRGVQRMLKLAGTAKGYTTPIATKNNSKEAILGYITTQIEKVNQLDVGDADKTEALSEMWQDYSKVQAMPNNIFGGSLSNKGREVGMTTDPSLLQGGRQTNDGTSFTRGGLLDEGGEFEGESWLDGDGDGY